MYVEGANDNFSNLEFENNPKIDEINVQMKTLRYIFEKYILSEKNIDLLNIDVEGFELEVINSNDWEKYRPKYVLIEIHKYDAQNIYKDEIVKRMKDFDYSIKSIMPVTVLFENRKIFTEN